MSRRPYLALYSGDYHRDTADLTTEEHGAYLLLLMACWDRGGTLPNDEKRLRAITKMSPRKFSNFAKIFVRYFALGNDNAFHNKRVDRDIQHVENVANARSKAGSKGAAKRLANAQQTTKQNSSYHYQGSVFQTEPEPLLETKNSNPARAREGVNPAPALSEPKTKKTNSGEKPSKKPPGWGSVAFS